MNTISNLKTELQQIIANLNKNNWQNQIQIIQNKLHTFFNSMPDKNTDSRKNNSRGSSSSQSIKTPRGNSTSKSIKTPRGNSALSPSTLKKSLPSNVLNFEIGPRALNLEKGRTLSKARQNTFNKLKTFLPPDGVIVNTYNNNNAKSLNVLLISPSKENRQQVKASISITRHREHDHVNIFYEFISLTDRKSVSEGLPPYKKFDLELSVVSSDNNELNSLRVDTMNMSENSDTSLRDHVQASTRLIYEMMDDRSPYGKIVTNEMARVDFIDVLNKIKEPVYEYLRSRMSTTENQPTTVEKMVRANLKAINGDIKVL